MWSQGTSLTNITSPIELRLCITIISMPLSTGRGMLEVEKRILRKILGPLKSKNGTWDWDLIKAYID